MKPVENLLPTNPDERVIFVSTDSLFYLPFAALVDEEGKFLIEKHTILMSPAITVLETTHKQRQNLSSSAKDIRLLAKFVQSPSPPFDRQMPPARFANGQGGGGWGDRHLYFAIAVINRVG
ncbi:CHAT domain-containing protein [Planktothricoides raciborskii]|uniref:CHAT domain-containing protein n=1 Tax=Planktothricoides raciborskii TaxID=132608 RepID=UPI002100D5D8|nr:MULTISPECIES: CHAT domain-containing protein [Planktothricoides]